MHEIILQLSPIQFPLQNVEKFKGGGVNTYASHHTILSCTCTCVVSLISICLPFIFTIPLPCPVLPLCQSVVNLISELQEQMCRIQQELSCKIQEKKAAEIQEDEDTDTDALLNEPASAEETSAEEQSSGDLSAEELCHCERESVGTE